MRLDVDDIAAKGGFSENLAEALYATKSRDWEYEEEVRFQTRLADCISHDNLYCEPLAANLAITGVALGPLCAVTADEIKRELPAGFSVKLYRSRLALSSFRVVQNKAFAVETIRGL